MSLALIRGRKLVWFPTKENNDSSLMSHQKKHRPSSLQSEELKFILISAEISFQLKKSLGNIFVSLNNPENDFGIIYSKIAIFTAEKSEKNCKSNF